MIRRNGPRKLPGRGPFLWFATEIVLLTCIVIGSNPNISQVQLSNASPDGGRVSIAHATISNSTPVYVAVQKGYFKSKLDISLHSFPAGRDALNEVLKGSADVATVAETPFMNAVMRGARVSILATISETTNSLFIIGRKDKGLRLAGDLKGKSIGVAKATGGEFFLDNVLIFNGISKSEVKKVDIPVEKMLALLVNGEVEAVVSWEPFADELRNALGTNMFIYYGLPTYNRYSWNLVSLKSWIEKKPQTVKEVIRVLIRGVQFIKKNPSEARTIAEGYLKTGNSETDRIWGNTVFKIGLHPSLLMSLEDQARWVIRNKYSDASTVPNFLSYIYFDGLEALDPAAVTIAH
jgi:NitT/TauT family transport system substrate-binding protein